MGSSQILGAVGAVVLFIGAFVPILSGPLIGTLNYFQYSLRYGLGEGVIERILGHIYGIGEGVIVLILALVSLVMALTKRRRWLWMTGLLSLGVLAFTFINVLLWINASKGREGLIEPTIYIQWWGWVVMVVGACLIITAAIRWPTSRGDGS